MSRADHNFYKTTSQNKLITKVIKNELNDKHIALIYKSSSSIDYKAKVTSIFYKHLYYEPVIYKTMTDEEYRNKMSEES